MESFIGLTGRLTRAIGRMASSTAKGQWWIVKDKLFKESGLKVRGLTQTSDKSINQTSLSNLYNYNYNIICNNTVEVYSYIEEHVHFQPLFKKVAISLIFIIKRAFQSLIRSNFLFK